MGATTDASSAEERYGKAVATVMFVMGNTTLLVVHASLVAVPLWQQMSAGCTSARDKLHGRFAADAEECSSGDVVMELETNEEATNGAHPQTAMWAQDTAVFHSPHSATRRDVTAHELVAGRHIA